MATHDTRRGAAAVERATSEVRTEPMELMMDREKMGDEAYSAYVDMRAEIEVLSGAMYALLTSMIMGYPKDQRASIIQNFERSLGNRQMPPDLETQTERQYFVHLSTAIEAKAKDYAETLRTLTARAEAGEAEKPGSDPSTDA